MLQIAALRFSIVKLHSLQFFILSLIFIIFLNLLKLNLNLIFFSIFFIYLYFCFIITIPGIINLGPSLYLIKLIHKNKTFNRNKIKDKFIKENFVKKRLQENLNSKIIFKEKNQLKLTKIGYLIINFFNKISKIFKLKSDVR
tara:strand:+ start:3745 stop:4170 length:426 start_codon:yes stop_codon:yes gene_type:complete